jgi:3-phenylpropionate/trans-cinnamate dioxygenase ferredoxin reductase component
MPHYRYLLVGGGIAADAAARGIRELDADADIGLIGAEPHPPYDRPPLSKELWRDGSIDSIWRGTEDLDVQMHLGRRAERLDAAARSVTDDHGTVYTFEKLLLATGGTPLRLAGDTAQVVYFRTLDDYTRLRTLAEQGGRFLVIGGGWIGPEIAAALRQHGRNVVMTFAEPWICARVLPPELARRLTEHYRQQGVEVLPGEMVSGIRQQEEHTVVSTRSGRTLYADVVVAGLGIRPNTQLARAAGLPVDNGIRVDEMLRAGHPDIFAAGDVANFHSSVLGSWLRIEHEDAANTMGHHAGRGMAGQLAPYDHLPYFYSELFDHALEAVGELDPLTMEIAEDWAEPFQRGAVFYLRGGRVRGVLLWNLRGKLRKARRLIQEPGPFSAADLRGRLTT